VKQGILFISHRAGLAGSENSLLTLLEGLDREMFEPYAIVPSDGPLLTRLQELSIPVDIVQQGQWVGDIKTVLGFMLHFFSRLIKTVQVIKKYKIALVYSNTELSPMGALAALICRVPHIWHLRMFLGHIPELRTRLLPGRSFFDFILRVSEYVIANSVTVASQFGNRQASGKLAVIYNGVNTDGVAKAVPKQLALWSSDATLDSEMLTGRLLAVIGYIGPYRRQEDAVRAMPALLARHKDITLLLIGNADEKYLEHLLRLTGQLGIDQKVLFCRPINNVISVMRKCYLILVPASVGSYGRVTLEAMSQGVPVLGSDAASSEEVIIDGVNGYLHKTADHADIARKALLLLDDPARRDAMGHKALDIFRSRYTSEIYVRKVSDLITAALR